MNTCIREIEDRQLIGELRRMLYAGNVTLFAGSGLSATARTEQGRHPPVWKGLLKGMVNWCLAERLIPTEYADQIRDLIERGYLTDAGEELHENLEPTLLQRCLSDVLLVHEAKPSEAHSLAARLPFRAYLTTNYDGFIEGAYCAQKRKDLRRFYEGTIKGVRDCLRERTPFILKLHGDVDDPSSIVLGNRGYERLLYLNNTYRSCLELIFSMTSVLFIGFGGSDPDLDRLVNWVAMLDDRDKRHWMLIPAGSFPPLFAKRLWQDKGIGLIQFELDPNYSGVERFLRALSAPPVLRQPSATAAPSPEALHDESEGWVLDR